MFPPGRARLATKPLPTGSLTCAMTIGIVVVTSFVARVDVGPPATMTSTLRRASSAPRSGSRSNFPSAYRHSMTMFLPSTYPCSRKPCRKASVQLFSVEAKVASKTPIRGTFFGCWAAAEKQNKKSIVHKPAIRTRRSKIDFPTEVQRAQRKSAASFASRRLISGL
jgi:hypothetical protein